MQLLISPSKQTAAAAAAIAASWAARSLTQKGKELLISLPGAAVMLGIETKGHTYETGLTKP